MRNTKWVYGVVIYAGKDTKLMMNTGQLSTVLQFMLYVHLIKIKWLIILKVIDSMFLPFIS